MAEYIERESLLKALEDIGGCDAPPDSWADGYDRGILSAITVVENQPTADVAEVRRGEWIYGEFNIPHCSECGYEVTPNMISPYCPHCGARMDGDAK